VEHSNTQTGIAAWHRQFGSKANGRKEAEELSTYQVVCTAFVDFLQQEL